MVVLCLDVLEITVVLLVEVDTHIHSDHLVEVMIRTEMKKGFRK